MKKILLVLMGVIILNPSQLFAGDEEDIKKQILANNAYAKKIIMLPMSILQRVLWNFGQAGGCCIL